ncbi:hypothetical protein L9F63_019474, partial [Diploptera punctata]
NHSNDNHLIRQCVNTQVLCMDRSENKVMQATRTFQFCSQKNSIGFSPSFNKNIYNEGHVCPGHALPYHYIVSTRILDLWLIVSSLQLKSPARITVSSGEVDS